MEERDDYIPEQKGNEKRITPFERFVPGIIPAHEIACQNQEKCHAAVENRKLEQAGEREGSYILKFGKNFLRIVSFLERIYLV